MRIRRGCTPGGPKLDEREQGFRRAITAQPSPKKPLMRQQPVPEWYNPALAIGEHPLPPGVSLLSWVRALQSPFPRPSIYPPVSPWAQRPSASHVSQIQPRQTPLGPARRYTAPLALTQQARAHSRVRSGEGAHGAHGLSFFVGGLHHGIQERSRSVKSGWGN